MFKASEITASVVNVIRLALYSEQKVTDLGKEADVIKLIVAQFESIK